MKYAAEWGSGCTVIRESFLDSLYRRTKSGASGMVVPGNKYMDNFCLKIVRMIEEDGSLNDLFWNEARSVSVYASAARNIPGCAACPLPPSYWIWEEDPLYVNFPRGRMSEERPRALVDYISLFDVKPEQLEEIDPATYWFVPPSLLKQIHDKKLAAQVLLTYPVLRGEENLREIIKKNRRKRTPEEGFSRWEHSLWNPSEVCKLIYHILSAILVLYRNGLAHGDIKPANIMRAFPELEPCRNRPSRVELNYFLTDLGSVHSGSHPSDSFTKKFFRGTTFDTWNDKLKLGKQNSGKPDYGKQNTEFIGDGGFKPETKLSAEQLNSLLRRTLMDGYALAVTIYSIAKGYEPDRNDASINHHLVEDKWHCNKITAIFDTLRNVQNLTIGKMQEIVDRLKSELPPKLLRFGRKALIKTYGRESEIGFDVEWIGKVDYSFVSDEERMGVTEVQYGKLSEQLNFSGKFNPMLRFYGERNKFVDGERNTFLHFPPEVVMQPIIETYSNGGNFLNAVYYAPDDAESGNRPVDFKKGYRPCTLESLLDDDRLTEEDVEELSALGHSIDEYRAENGVPLPYPQDIVKVDGKWMIQPFFLGRLVPDEPISIEEYFKMLCGKDNKLTPQNLADLLEYDHGVGILFELMPENMVRTVAELLNVAAEIDPESVEDRDERRRIYHNQGLRRKLSQTKKFGKYLSVE